MMTPRDQFARILDEFSEASGLDVHLEADNSALLVRDSLALALSFLPQSETVVAWTTLGFLGDDANADRRVQLLLQWNDDPAVTHGFSFALDEAEGRVLLHGRKDALALDSADRLAAWLDLFLSVFTDVRDRLDREAPFVDDDPLDNDITLVEDPS